MDNKLKQLASFVTYRQLYDDKKRDLWMLRLLTLVILTMVYATAFVSAPSNFAQNSQFSQLTANRCI